MIYRLIKNLDDEDIPIILSAYKQPSISQFINYQYYHNTLQYNALGKAFALCRESRYEEAMKELKKAKDHAQIMVQYSQQGYYCFTAPLFDHVSGEKPKTDSQTTDLDDFYKSLDNNTCFDLIRNTDEFKALYK